MRELPDEIDVVDPSKLPSSVEPPSLEDEANVKKRCERFGLEGPIRLSSEHSETMSMNHRHAPTKSVR